MSTLARFVDAQARPYDGFDAALRELSSTGKQRHWIWYVFPQLAGLGQSAMSQRYAIAGPPEAEGYLRDSTLRHRYLAVTNAVADQLARGMRLDRIMGSSIDTIKLVSSLTLFRAVAARLARLDTLEGCDALANAAERILARAAHEGYPACQHTLTVLRDARYDALE